MYSARSARTVGSQLALVAGMSGVAIGPANGEQFVERASEVGLVHEHRTGLDRVGIDTPMLDWVQSGVSLGDIDGDGDLDLVAAGGLAVNHVFRNDGDHFTDISEVAAIDANDLDRVPALADVDGDGDLDLFLGVLGPGDGPEPGRSRLYRNDGGGRFTEVTALAATLGNGHTIHAKWADLDLDGLLDLYTAEFHGTRNRLYRNNGDGSFTEISRLAGVDDGGSAHVVAAVDVDEDGLLDLFVGNDFVISSSMDLSSNSTDHQLQGTVDGQFVNVSFGSGADQPATTMGLAFGDVDYDGRLDVYKTEYGFNYLLENHGWPASGQPWTQEQYPYEIDSSWIDDPARPGEIGSAVGWGAAFFDADLDTWLDLLVVNGHVADRDPRGQHNQLFLGAGPELPFVESSEALGLADPLDDRGLAIGDVDRDGDVDLVVAPANGPLRYYENRLDRAGRGSVTVRPLTRTSAPGGHGVVARWRDSEGYLHVRAVGSDSPTASQHAREIVFGIGTETEIDLEVTFPSGIVRRYRDVAADTVVVADEPRLFELPYRTVAAGTAEPLTVVAFAHGRDGRPLGPTAEVAIDLPGATPLGPVEHVSESRFERRFTVPAEPGAYRIGLRFDAFQPRIRPRLLVRGEVSPTASTVLLVPEAVRAGSDDPIRIEVAPKDVQGVALGAGHQLVARLRPDGEPFPLRDLGDGRYRADLVAPAEPDYHDLLVSVDGAGPWPLAKLEAGASASAESTRIHVETPDPFIAERPEELKLTVQPADSLGRRLGPGAEVTVAFLPDAGSQPVGVTGAPAGRGRRDGAHAFVLTRPPGASGSAYGQIEVSVDGVFVRRLPVAF